MLNAQRRRCVTRRLRAWFGQALFAAFLLPVPAFAGQTLDLLRVPYLTQPEALCGGAAAAMVLRALGEQDVVPESFSGLVDASAGGIRTDALTADLTRRGFAVVAGAGHAADLQARLAAGVPVIALIEDRPGAYHYVVVVGWHLRGVVFHDPARVPYRVMPVQEFERRWQRADRWMLTVPPRGSAPRLAIEEPLVERDPLSPCEARIRRGVGLAQANDLAGAEEALVGALSCPGVEARRELAGVRALQARWPESAELAEAVARETPGDAYAWQVLATARFMTGDQQAALSAWNGAGQPLVDLLEVTGLQKTQQRVVERLSGLRRGLTLTPDRLARASRQLAEWPASTRAVVSYVPRPAGRADVRFALAERDIVPRRPLTLSMIGARTVFTREVRVPLGPLTTQGDRLELAWRFWPDRPRYSVALLAPAPWSGLWGVQASVEEQPFTAPLSRTMRRASASLVASAWPRGWLRWQVSGGLDRWRERGRFGTVGLGVDLAGWGDAVRVRARGQSWFGDTRFGTMDATVRVTRPIGASPYFVEARAGAVSVSNEAPLDLWAAGDTGQVRPTLLRAHPLVRRGRFRSSRIGTDVTTLTVELQRLSARRGVRLGPALFVDLGRTSGRALPGSVRDVDVGLGFRVRMPGAAGMARVDLAKGLRDGATAVSFVYEAGF